MLTARDYALVLGMPGTGKTAVIVAAVRALVVAHRTVLLTSYTNRYSTPSTLLAVFEAPSACLAVASKFALPQFIAGLIPALNIDFSAHRHGCSRPSSMASCHLRFNDAATRVNHVKEIAIHACTEVIQQCNRVLTMALLGCKWRWCDESGCGGTVLWTTCC